MRKKTKENENQVDLSLEQIKAQKQIQLYASSTWTNDSLLLMDIINNGIDITIATDITFLNLQIRDSKGISSDEAVAAATRTNSWVLQKIGDTPYEDFLCMKYFGTKEKLYQYVSDIVTSKLYSETLKLNHTRVMDFMSGKK